MTNRHNLILDCHRSTEGPTTKATARLQWAYFWLSGATSLFYAYANLYYETLGFSAFYIGLLAAVGPLMALTTQPAWGIFADRRLGILPTLRFALIGAALASLLATIPTSFVPLLAAITLLMTLEAAHWPLLDAQTMCTLEADSSRFGRIRVAGSVGFAACVGIIGHVLASTKLVYLFPAHAACLTLAAAFLRRGSSEKGAVASSRRRLKVTLSPKLLSLLGTTFLLTLSIYSGNVFLGNRLAAMGAEPSWVGKAHTIGAIACWPFFFYSKPLIDRFGPARLLGWSALATSVRWVLTGLVGAPIYILALELLHGPAFALSTSAAVVQMHRLSRDLGEASGQGLLAAVVTGLAPMTGGLLSGVVWQWWGINQLYLLLAGVAALGWLAASLLDYLFGAD